MIQTTIKYTPVHELHSQLLNLFRSLGQLTLFTPVRKSSRAMPRGQNRKRCSQGFKHYNQRNIVESVMHMLKSRYITQLQSKQHHMKKRETAWKIIAYNLERLRKTTNQLFQSLLHRLILDTAKFPQHL